MSEREPITTELRAKLDVDREFMRADGTVVAQTFCVDRGDFERCCDAIDAVHAGLERENAELRQRVAELDNRGESMHETDAWKLGYDEGFASADDWLGQHEDAMAEHGWIRLPLDADGEYIHAGDVLDGYGKSIEVVELRHGRSGWVLISRDGNGYADTFAFTHHHAPTVEDVLREFLDEAEHFHSLEEERDAISEYAKRLTLAESE